MIHDNTKDQSSDPIAINSDKGKVTFYIDPTIDHKVEVLCAISKISKSNFVEKALQITIEMLTDDDKLTWQEIADRIRIFFSK